MDSNSPKRRAALKALEYLPSEGIVGLGTGSTAAFFIEGVAEAIRSGKRLQCVVTSEQSRVQAIRLNIPLLDNIGPWDIDVCVDGADEISDDLDLIKGGGGCHLREKIVNQSSRYNVIIADESKLSPKLGQRASVPVEVVVFGHVATGRLLREFGRVSIRAENGVPWQTDSGNFIYDVKVGEIADPGRLDQDFHRIPGVVETGLFVGRTDLLIVGSESGTRCVKKSGSVDPAKA
jgi:ribose 5-phosphate isomerase A